MVLDAWIYTRGAPEFEYDDGPTDIIAYFRKHPNLHGWMEHLWLKKNGIPIDSGDQFIEGKYPPYDDFNGKEVELTRDDINQLEKDVVSGKMKELQTTGFFFGTPSDDYYQKTLLDACNDARWRLFLKQRVFYNSSW